MASPILLTYREVNNEPYESHIIVLVTSHIINYIVAR